MSKSPHRGLPTLPLQTKVGVVAGVATAIALAVTLSGVTWLELRRAPRDLETELMSVIASTEASVGAMMYLEGGRQKEEAAEQLGYLSAFPAVEEAWIVDQEGNPFVEFRKEGHPKTHRLTLEQEGSLFTDDFVVLRKDIIEQDEFLGSLYIEANLNHIHSLRDRYLLWGLVAAFVGFMASILVAHPLRLWLTRPILALAGVAERVKLEGRHDLRATKTTHDEVGSLVDSFNNMLDAVQHREEQIRASRTEAERLAEDRARQASELELTNLQLMDEMDARKRLQEQLVHAQKMESIGQLAGGIAHDFNNLLTVILGWSEYAAGNDDDIERMREGLEQIQRSGERAATLTRQLLAFARRQVIRPEDVQMNALIQEMNQLISSVMGDDVEIRLQLDPDIADVRVDPGQFEQIFLNVAINARDAMPGGGTFTLETSNERPSPELIERFELLHEREYVRIRLSDTGSGIDASMLDTIFEPFFTTKEKGTGLGLAMCYGIIRQSEGCITVDSKLGEGSSFNIFIPAASVPGEKTQEIRLDDRRATGTETILVVEDETSVRSLVDRSLRQFGYRVYTAPDGEAGLRLAKTTLNQLDLLITDLKMPGLGGHELLGELRALRPQLPALLISGFDAELSNSAELDDGVAFLQKPFTPKQLALAARHAMELATTETQAQNPDINA